MNERKKNLANLDYVLEEEKRKVDSLILNTREKEEQIITESEMEMVKRKAAAEKEEADTEKELESRSKENERLEKVSRNLKNCLEWCQERSQSVAKIIEVVKAIGKSADSADDLRQSALRKITTQNAEELEANEQLNAEAASVTQETEARIKAGEESKANHSVRMKELSDKLKLEKEKEQSLKETKDKIIESMEKCNEQIKEVDVVFEREQAACEARMQEITEQFEISFNNLLKSTKF
eukprot:TRINITY_DN222_c0_g1_i14.p1 TRINITY_DN222_c0_g1~~TRINITY_DN222_c0_g1_i14.p1  ORF type:complete len:238 (+),score=82.85 TRINITY_DN222_c0_g1_i14:951-1664(+)